MNERRLSLLLPLALLAAMAWAGPAELAAERSCSRHWPPTACARW